MTSELLLSLLPYAILEAQLKSINISSWVYNPVRERICKKITRYLERMVRRSESE